MRPVICSGNTEYSHWEMWKHQPDQSFLEQGNLEYALHKLSE